MRFSCSGMFVGAETVKGKDGKESYRFGIQQGLETLILKCDKSVYDVVSKTKPYTPVVADVQQRTWEGRVYYTSAGLSNSQ